MEDVNQDIVTAPNEPAPEAQEPSAPPEPAVSELQMSAVGETPVVMETPPTSPSQGEDVMAVPVADAPVVEDVETGKSLRDSHAPTAVGAQNDNMGEVDGGRVKVVEKVVEKPVEVEKIVERVVEKPVEIIKEVKVFDEAKAVEENRKKLIGSRGQALAARRKRKEGKLEKILEFATQHGKVTNDEAQVLLGISNRSATRYLFILAKTGRLKKVNRGRWAHYEPISS